MLQQIIIHTPIWVWAILAFLLYRGLLASRDRELGLKSIFVIPLVMLLLSLQGIAATFGFNLASTASWLASLLLGGAIAWRLVNERDVKILPQRAGVFYRGSWGPMLLMMAIFLIKYCVNVMLSIHAAWRGDTGFIALVCLAYGLFNGLFLGKMLRVLLMYKQQAAVLARAEA